MKERLGSPRVLKAMWVGLDPFAFAAMRMRRAMMKKMLLALGLPGLALGTAMVVPATPGFTQPADEEIVITGRWRRDIPDDYQSASQSVSYADLDLSTDFGRSELKHRIRLSARYLCNRLGETDTGPGSCRQEAARDAFNRVGTLEAHFAPRGSAWVRPQAWHAPYDDAWAARYPDENW